MGRTLFAPDRGLVTRMVTTMFLLGLLYVVFVAFFIAVLGARYAPVIVLIAAGFLFFQWYASDRIALFAMHGREDSPEEAPQLHAMVDRLCALANMPKPRVALADSDVGRA